MLTLAGIMPHQRATCHHQIGTSIIQRFIHQEKLLFRTQIRIYALYVFIKIVRHCRCRLTHCGNRTQQRSLVIQRLTCICHKDSRNTQSITYHKRRRRRIPCRVTTCLKGIANTAIGEGRGIWFLLIKYRAREFLHRCTLLIEVKECIMLLRRSTCQGLKPVRIMRSTLLHRPFLHTNSHTIGYITTECLLIIHQVKQLLHDIAGYILLHFIAREDILRKNHTRTLNTVYFLWLMRPCYFQSIKSDIRHKNTTIIVFNQIIFQFRPQKYYFFRKQPNIFAFLTYF